MQFIVSFTRTRRIVIHSTSSSSLPLVNNMADSRRSLIHHVLAPLPFGDARWIQQQTGALPLIPRGLLRRRAVPLLLAFMPGTRALLAVAGFRFSSLRGGSLSRRFACSVCMSKRARTSSSPGRQVLRGPMRGALEPMQSYVCASCLMFVNTRTCVLESAVRAGRVSSDHVADKIQLESLTVPHCVVLHVHRLCC